MAVPMPLSMKVTPTGSEPDSVKVGVGAPVAVTVNDPEVPSLNEAVVADVIVGAAVVAVTVNDTEVLCVVVPVPVTVIPDVPRGVDVAVVMVIVEDWPEDTVVGLKVAVTPAGSPDPLRVSCSGEPPVTAVLMVLLVDEPATTVAGAPEIEKSFEGGAAVAAALNIAIPAAQYIDFANEPAKLWLPVAVRFW